MTKIRSKNEAKRNQILTAATELFTENGYLATSMSQIAQHADVSKQTVYSHFGSKEDLFAASIANKCDAEINIDVDTLDFSNLPNTFLLVAKRFFDMITSKEALAVHKICAFESKTYPQLSELFYEAGPERLTDEMTKLMEKCHQLGLLKIEKPRHAAIQFLNLMKGEGWMRCEFNTKKQLTESEVMDYLSSCVDMFMRAYSAQ
ncbi:TetR/AcrR family transcriptional regulator [Thalassotalea euphylliae]|uniref:TetR/AcrR family transcriptional regulator n=1 Tax=Thalassotalea euphylliae TaxID=1655234 RepID=UPI00362C07F0